MRPTGPEGLHGSSLWGSEAIRDTQGIKLSFAKGNPRTGGFHNHSGQLILHFQRWPMCLATWGSGFSAISLQGQMWNSYVWYTLWSPCNSWRYSNDSSSSLSLTQIYIYLFIYYNAGIQGRVILYLFLSVLKRDRPSEVCQCTVVGSQELQTVHNVFHIHN